MLGLLSAGAGAYTLFKDKPAPKDSDSGKSSSGGGAAAGRSGGDSNVRGDRGKEIPISFPDGGSSGSQTGGPPTQTGQGPSPQGGTGQQPLPAGEPKLGKEDSQKHKEEFPGLRKKPKLNLKNKVDDIIRNNSKFANHRRPLINAEALVDKESFNGALEIYKRTKTRVPDEEIRKKIQENIDQIQDHLENDDEDVYRPDHFGGPPIPLGDLVRAIRDISDSLGDTIAKGFSHSIPLPLSPLDPGAISGSSDTTGPVSYQIFSPGPPLPPEEPIPLPSPGTGEKSFPSSGGGSGGSPGAGSGGVGTPSSGGGSGGSPGAGSGGVGTPSGGGGSGGSPGAGPGVVGTPSGVGGGSGGSPGAGSGVVGTPSGGGGSGGSPGAGSGVVGTPSGGGGSGGSPGAGSAYAEPSAMDLPDDTFFSEEWEKFKDLPLVDRRTGESRRSGPDRRGANSNRKDRRQDEDRRKEDLFKLRDEYLKQKEEQKKREREETSSQNQEAIDYDYLPERDDLPPFLAPILPKIELVPIRLPDPQDKTVRPLEEKPPEVPSSAPSGELRLEAPASSEAPEKESKPLELPKIGLPEPEYQKAGETTTPEIPHLAPESGGAPDETPEIEVLEGGLEPLGEETEEEAGSGGDGSGEGSKEEEPRMIHGILELKPPEVDDAPFLTLTYDFDKIPHAFKLSKNYSIMEYSYYKYKPMLVKAQEFARRKMLKNALNYYRVIKSQNIPPELRKMINRNIKDITEFMEKYLMAKGG
ncbi:hypothetical protein LEP1GSC060_0249 [Leptospira weilii serovar Ranarum str. ICFT]|uniref:Uncharacterized protein n=2 Tax=Leptospira weilii TaxID=28184 RepID=N1W847_9LEPT|nr:hypothetical protein LEP1GSC060_0249 [Leptospira weilii serovar Ranarum str. ICFT]